MRVFPVHMHGMMLGFSRRHQKWARTQLSLKITFSVSEAVEKPGAEISVEARVTLGGFWTRAEQELFGTTSYGSGDHGTWGSGVLCQANTASENFRFHRIKW